MYQCSFVYVVVVVSVIHRFFAYSSISSFTSLFLLFFPSHMFLLGISPRHCHQITLGGGGGVVYHMVHDDVIGVNC